MKRAFLALGMGAIISTAASAAPNFILSNDEVSGAGTSIIFDRTYEVTPRTPYQTGFFEVIGGMVHTNRITLKQSGNGCKLVSDGVRYLNSRSNLEKAAILVETGAAIYQIPDGQITAINLLFEQTGIYRANCRITVEAEIEDHGGGDDGEWVDWDTASTFEIKAEWGGEPNRVGPFEINDLVKAARIYIPRACGDVELVDSALQINGEWQELGSEAFNMERTEDYKTFARSFGGVTQLNQAAFRIRGKRRDCTAELQVVYY